jgi:two-component system nitrate/nitrite response regulator NarL
MRHFATAAKKLRHPPLAPKRAMLANENAPLTKREHQIVQVLAEGITNKEIGRRLGLTEGTVKVHLHRIYRKLGIANRTVLAVLAPTIALIRR